MGDDFREHREWRRAVRNYWEECPNCAISFGTGTKVAPGDTCRHCGWLAPGKRGSDTRRASQDQRMKADRSAIGQKQKEAQALKRRCLLCNKSFGSTNARQHHERDVHGLLYPYSHLEGRE